MEKKNTFFLIPRDSAMTTDKVYIGRPCGFKTLAGVLLGMVGPWNFPTQMFAVRLGPEIS